tara:strand:+ start:262 stop:564 length:303 start_codon:yes stop_codon:yes gene_type:complete
MYIYKANLIRVVSGDTLRCNIDLGFCVILQNMKIKLLNIESPSGVDGEDAKDYLKSIMPQKFSIKTKMDGGLIIADVMVNGESISEKMLTSGKCKKFISC